MCVCVFVYIKLLQYLKSSEWVLLKSCSSWKNCSNCIWNLRMSRPGPEKAMAPHCSTLTWKIPWMEEPGKLQSMGSLRVRHD